MPNSLVSPRRASAPYTDDLIRRKIDVCPKLASLQSINNQLTSLVNSEQSLTSQIAEIIRLDPSLSSRILRMVNSVYFGLSANITDIEEAVFFLGLRQIRELSRATPVIEELTRIQNAQFGPELWKCLWSHSIGTAILTREILSSASARAEDETNYLVGLLHNLGKIIMAYAFPEELMAVASTPLHTPGEVCALEREHIGWDHAWIGAYYLERHHLSKEIVCAVRYHNEPDKAPDYPQYPAAVQVADYLVRHVGVASGFEQVEPVAEDAWTQLPGWQILFGANETEAKIARASLANTLQRLPEILSGLI